MLDDPTAIRDELCALLSQPGLAEKMRRRMEQPLFADGNKEEWARAELRSNLGAPYKHALGALAAAGGEDVTADECLENGWPSGCFRTCTCASRCMVRLARRQGGAVLGAMLERLRSAQKHDESQPTNADQRAQASLERSAWRSAGLSGLSPLLQACTYTHTHTHTPHTH